MRAGDEKQVIILQWPKRTPHASLAQDVSLSCISKSRQYFQYGGAAISAATALQWI